MFLTEEDLRDLTGYCRPSKQVEWLRREGFTFRVAADGHPSVLLDHVRTLMGVSVLAKQKTRPDFSSMGV